MLHWPHQMHGRVSVTRRTGKQAQAVQSVVHRNSAVLDKALLLFAGWVTEGDSAFGEMSGSTPKSIHQQALRGIAKVLMEVC